MFEDAIVRLAGEQEETLLNAIVIAPKTVSQIIDGWTPKISESAKKFLVEFAKQREAIQAADDDDATALALDCVFAAGVVGTYIKGGRYALEGKTAEEAATEALKKIQVLRQGWAALRVIQEEVETWA
ncbi:MAG: hypothetical protein HPY45_01875 [Anaerolineae bacterium]|nr:hypothetical protein [Anaerolineae bacterium]